MNSPHDTPQRTANMHRIGTIVEVDYARYRARVKTGGIVSDWLRWTTERNGLVRTWNPPVVGEEVEVIALDGSTESAYIGQSFYNEAFPPPATDGNLVVVAYADGTRIEHNRATGVRTVSGLATLNQQIITTQHTGDITNHGVLTHNGSAALTQGVTVSGAPADMTSGITGQGGVSIDIHHTHTTNDHGQPTSGVNP